MSKRQKLDGHKGIGSQKQTRETLRKDAEGSGTNVAGLIRINLGDGSEIYRGMEVKGIVNELSQDNLLLAVKNSNFRVVEALCVNYKLINVCEIRGIHGNFELMKREVYNIANWNLLLIAIAYNHIQAIQFFSQKLKCHLRIALRAPPIASFSKVQESDPAHSEIFPLLLAINNRNEDMIKFLWSDLRLLWDSFHISCVISELASCRFVEGIRAVLRSQTAHEIYMSMHSSEKLRFLRQALATDKRNQRKWTLEVKEALKEEITGQNPYATVALFVLLNDSSQGSDSTASFNLNRLHLERALINMDAIEYARFRHTMGLADPGKKAEDFGMIVTMKIGEYLIQEESNSMRHFGEKLRDRLESLDQEVIRLKAPGLASAHDFEQIFGVKLFALAEKGSLEEFCQLVQENDVRLFTKRKRVETVARKLPQSFQGLNRYGYMSPLLVAIQKGHHALVSFIIEQMKIPLRQSLYLFPSDPGSASSNIDSISEEYQAYALLVATYNKDEQMLRYLWQCLGSYLWTERHFEPLMRALIETQWAQGIRTILQCEMTHDMIRALSSEERAFFVDNMIGDNLKIGIFAAANSSLSSQDPVVALRAAALRKAKTNMTDASMTQAERERMAEEIQSTLKEELTKQPYAGLFILHMMSHFEELTEDDFVSWDQCCQITLDQSVLRNSEAGSQGGLMGDRPRGIHKNRLEQLDETKRSSAQSGMIEIEIQPQATKYGVYKTELLLLSKSQQSRFCHFIMDYGINRKDDIFRQQALKFIECLRQLPEYEPLIEEGTEEAIINGDEEVQFIKKDLQLASQLTGTAVNLADILKFSITGNVRQIQKLMVDTHQLDAHTIHVMMLHTRGLAVKAYDHSRDNTLIATREWCPLFFAIFFQQYKLLRMFIEELSGVAPGGLRSDLKAAISFSHTENEFKEDHSYDELIGTHPSESHLYGFMMAILTKNMAIFKYLYEESGIQLSESDVLRILRMCLIMHWPQGFLGVINSVVTARIFTFGSLDFKEEFVRFALIECESLVSMSVASSKQAAVPSQSDEDVIREVKDRMTEFPYCCISWLFFDPFHKELKNQRYIKRLMEETSFNIRALDILAVANQLDKILKKCDKPRINLDLLGKKSSPASHEDIKIMTGNSQEAGQEQDPAADDLAQKNRQEDLMNQRIHEHKMMYVNKVKQIIETGGQTTSYLKKANQYSDICENIVIEILQKPIMPGPNGIQIRIKKFEDFLKVAFPPQPQITDSIEDIPQENQGVDTPQRIAIMLRFVNGFYNFSYWKSMQIKAPLDQIEMESLNLFQWIIFFNDHRILNHLLIQTATSQYIQLLQCLTGDQQPIEYTLVDVVSGDDLHTIYIEKVGLIIAICRRQFECLKLLLIPRSDLQSLWSTNLLTNQEILELALIIMHEPHDLWRDMSSFDRSQTGEPGKPNVQLETRIFNMVENAFVGSSILRRLQFLRLAMKCAKHGFKDGSFLDMLVKNSHNIKYFLQWLNTQPLAECSEPVMIEVKQLMKGAQIPEIKAKDDNYEFEMQRLHFITRYKPKKIESAKIDQVNAAAARQQIQDQEMEAEIEIANKAKAAAAERANAGSSQQAQHQRGKSSWGAGDNRAMFEDPRDSAEADSD